MTLAAALDKTKEIEAITDAAERTREMCALVVLFKGETDRPPLRHLMTADLLSRLDLAFHKAYNELDEHCGVDTVQSVEKYTKYIVLAGKAFKWHCYGRLDDKDGDGPTDDDEKIVLEGMPGKAHVWMTCHPHLLLADHQRMPFLTKGVMASIIAGLSRMPSTLSEVSRLCCSPTSCMPRLSLKVVEGRRPEREFRPLG